MGKRLSQLTLIEGVNLDKEDYLLIDGERYLESKKIKLKDIDLNKFNTSNFYNKNQVDSIFVKGESGKGLSTNDFTKEYKDKLDNSQEKLVDGVNIKTINNESILGEGNIEIQGGSGGSGTIIRLITWGDDD